MAATIANSGLTGLARALVQEKWLSESEAEALAKQAASSGEGFISQVISVKKIKPVQIAEFALLAVTPRDG